MYDVTRADLDRCTPNEAMRVLNKLDLNAMKNPMQHETLEREKRKFKWICCDETFSSAYKGGCKKGKHGFIMKCQQSSTETQYATVDDWEGACLANDEYHEKWLDLQQ